MILGEKLKKLRKARGLSQEQLADQLKVSRQAISKWELGESTPDTGNLVALRDYFGVSIDYLLKNQNLQHKFLLKKYSQSSVQDV